MTRFLALVTPRPLWQRYWHHRLHKLVERELAKLEARNFDKRSRASRLGWANRKARKVVV